MIVDHNNLEEEAAFADAEYASAAEGGLGISPRMFAKYVSPLKMWDWRQRVARLMSDLHGKLVLDYGCGMGEEAVYFAKLGAKVTAIDISKVGVEIAQQRARVNGVSERVEAHIMDATATDFPSQSFDLNP